MKSSIFSVLLLLASNAYAQQEVDSAIENDRQLEDGVDNDPVVVTDDATVVADDDS